MIKIKNSEFIKLFESDITILKVGKIDMEVIYDESFYSLYYKFPLIERLVLEIYKLIPGTNIEMYEQGTMKTINSIINNNKEFNLILPDLKEMIDRYFYDSDDSPRNKIFHPIGDETIEVKVDFEEINCIIAKLLALLNHISKEYNLVTLKKIEQI